VNELPSDWLAPGFHRYCACGHLPSWHGSPGSSGCRVMTCNCDAFVEGFPVLRPATDEDWKKWVEEEPR
jgi:hypothetical protein